MSRYLRYDQARQPRARDDNVLHVPPPVGLLLSCGCSTRQQPQLSNPEKWWCCGAWRYRVRKPKDPA